MLVAVPQTSLSSVHVNEITTKPPKDSTSSRPWLVSPSILSNHNNRFVVVRKIVRVNCGVLGFPPCNNGGSLRGRKVSYPKLAEQRMRMLTT